MTHPLRTRELGLPKGPLIHSVAGQCLVDEGFLCRGFKEKVGFSLKIRLDPPQIRDARTRCKKDLTETAAPFDNLPSASNEIFVADAEHGHEKFLIHAAQKFLKSLLLDHPLVIGAPQGIDAALSPHHFKNLAVTVTQGGADSHTPVRM